MSPESPRPFDWQELLKRYGLGTLLALYLVYQLSNTLPAMARTLDAHVNDTLHQTRLLYAICLGINKSDDAARAMCEAGR